MSQGSNIKIKLKGFDYRIVDQSAAEIVNTAKGSGARVCGPIPMPTQIERFTVNRSPHVDKKSREHFEMRTHKRIIDIYEATQQTTEELSRLDLPAGVSINVKL